MSDTPPVPAEVPVTPQEELNKITYDPTAHLTEEQKTWPVVKVVQRDRFTMLEPKGPNNLTPEKTGWPVVGAEDTAPEVGASDLATIRGLIERYGVNRLQQIVGTLAAEAR